MKIEVLAGIIGIIGVIIGAIITYYLNWIYSKKTAIYNVLLEQYKIFVKLKENIDNDLFQLQVYSIKDTFDMKIEYKHIIIREMEKAFNTMQKLDRGIKKIKIHLDNNEFLLKNNGINTQCVFGFNGGNDKNNVLQEITNYKYEIDKFDMNILIKSEENYINFAKDFTIKLLYIKTELEKKLFYQKI